MPVIVLWPPDDLTAPEDEESMYAEYSAYMDANPTSQLAYLEWLAEFK